MANKKQKAAQEPAADGKQSGLPTPEEARAQLSGANRIHFEGLGMPWAVLLGGPVQQLMPQVVGTVLQGGGTRPAWHWTRSDQEYFLMAWPKDEPVRAAVLVSGKKDEKLQPVDAFPLIQGLPNDLTVEDVVPWKQGHGADVAAVVEEGRNPMWFYDPLYERDREDLTPGVKQTFLVGGLAFSLRKALLDNLTITQGPYYEEHARKWLEEHPEAKRLDVPPLQIPLTGRHLIIPGRQFGEYQMRATVEQVEDHKLDRMDVKLLYVRFPFEEREPLLLPLYASKAVLKDYEPKEGDEIDAYVWLQGRIIDIDDPNAPVPDGFVSEPAGTEPKPEA
ncbi:MAG: hypothetical protein Q4F72_00365 [Desulfovibrionaceae bacterium]|nr:hypothetical protein [Desulfovibrionaceae bacterium]